ncbi:uncharacterized protein LOC108714052 isoform X4 [Xenopus laevis]|uniref:Uncharacterized protein LOC108714052 isoform X4 n=1 Tax=Xenopus laevis TaxID=8355 RepID=A0A8J1MUF2_XENLA|nr:uncharacterized protein LOC108714052 isoform X4 [Xenopus laevis]
MASTHGDVALRPLQRAMKLANRAIQLDTGNWGGTAYKFPYQGCTAVYRGSDDMKKHIKEHHEEVRERPCPHPGCNKVFMIDQYLQRHVKLIHTVYTRTSFGAYCQPRHSCRTLRAGSPSLSLRRFYTLSLDPLILAQLHVTAHRSDFFWDHQPRNTSLLLRSRTSLASRFIPGLQPQSYSISATINPGRGNKTAKLRREQAILVKLRREHAIKQGC